MPKQFEYFLKNFQLFYNIDKIKINYGIENNGKITIAKNIDYSFWDNKKDINCSDIIWKEWKGVKIPFLFDKTSFDEIITFKKEKATINYDIVSSAFYFLSGWNEFVNCQKDDFGRVSYKHSIINKLNISSIPVVNYYFDILNDAISQIYGDSKRNIWKDKNFGVALTHDIDTCQSAWIEGSFSELKKKKIFSIPKLIFQHLFKKDEWLNFTKISAIEKKFNATSSFYFLPQKGKVGGWKNADYNINKDAIRKEILALETLGHEIGVHGSFGTHKSTDYFKIDKDKVKSKITGNRFHFLMFDLEETVCVLQNNKIKYDTTLGFAEQIGFRRGTCYPFYLYDFLNDNCSEILEIPLITMDSTLQNPKYMGLFPHEAFKAIVPLINETIKFNGVFTILWHNTFFSNYKYTGWEKVYFNILEYCNNNNGLLTSCKIIYDKTINKNS